MSDNAATDGNDSSRKLTIPIRVSQSQIDFFGKGINLLSIL